MQSQEDLRRTQEESQRQALPEQKRVFSVSEKIRRRVHNLPDPTRPPLGYDEHKAFDRVFPYIRLPVLYPPNHGDTVIFNASELPANRLLLGDNLEVLRNLPSESIDLIYIDPPFFSGRTYNVIWGDTNEVRSFYDIWEGGIDSYLIWLNARLWEMRRVLKKTGSIYVHCDWHAGHYIKAEMDKIFGYENFINEIVWSYRSQKVPDSRKKVLSRVTDTILVYGKTQDYKFKKLLIDRKTPLRTTLKKKVAGKIQNVRDEFGNVVYTEYTEKLADNIWDIHIGARSAEKIGYPTQKPIELMQRIIEISSDENDVVADFFCGGGSFLVAAMGARLIRDEKNLPTIAFNGNPRKFIGCDSSRVAISVTLNRLVKIGEEISGVKSNITTGKEPYYEKLQAGGIVTNVPNIRVSYHGVYPIDKFTNLSQEDFITFVLTCYGASRNTAEGITHGFRPPGQREPILVGPSNPSESIDAQIVKAFFDEIKAKLEPNKLVNVKIIGWRFNRQVVEYIKILQRYIEDNKLPMEIDLIPLDSRRFRQRVLLRYPDVDDAEFYLRFSKPPVIGDIRAKKVGPLEYEFEAVDAFSSNEDGWLVNCQWDFNYEVGHFAADKDYILSRQKIKVKGYGERFEAILTARHKFDKEGEYTIACKVQDNLAGETIFATEVKT